MAMSGKGLLWKGALAALALYALAVMVTARHGDRALYPAGGDTVTVYIVNNGFHTDIALPADQVMARGGVLALTVPANSSTWLLYGWGDAGFFTQRGFSLARIGDGARALFAPNNPSVIRVFGVDARPDQAFVKGSATPVVLSRAGFEALERHIEASFTARAGAPIAVPVQSNDGVFFASHEHFSALRTCNSWAADQLAAAGLPTDPAVDALAPLFALDLRLRSGVRD